MKTKNKTVQTPALHHASKVKDTKNCKFNLQFNPLPSSNRNPYELISRLVFQGEGNKNYLQLTARKKKNEYSLHLKPVSACLPVCLWISIRKRKNIGGGVD